MAERPEDLNLPNAVVTRIIKEAVSEGGPGAARGGRGGGGRPARLCLAGLAGLSPGPVSSPLPPLSSRTA